MSAFIDSLDIANRACDHCGVTRISSPDEDSKNNNVIAGVYDKLREAELKRNNWKFSIKRTVIRAVDTTTMLLDPHLYDATVTYQPGAVVKDEDETLWYSTVPNNLGNPPGSSTAWDQYFGPMTADLYDPTIGYFAGELVYKLAGNPGGYVVFMSLAPNNGDDPAAADAWNADTTYYASQAVSFGGSQWFSLIDLNIGITPADAPLAYDPTANYSIGNQVTATDGYIYTSATNSNIGFDPVTDTGGHWTATNVPAAWSRTPAIYPASTTWLPLFAGLKAPNIFYPVGAGPASQAANRNVFVMPAGFLKRAPQDPKAGSVSFLGAPSGRPYDDWVFEGNYLVTRDVYPIAFRFTSDVKDVRKMDAMFCEGLAARIGMDVCETLTQSTSKVGAIAQKYKVYMGEARTANAVEVGAEEPPEDDYITCRA